jgi:hypothetical protein
MANILRYLVSISSSKPAYSRIDCCKEKAYAKTKDFLVQTAGFPHPRGLAHPYCGFADIDIFNG